MGQNVDLSFIIVSFRDKEFLERAISSIIGRVRGLSYQMIVVDNDNSSELKSYIVTKFRDVHYILMEKNKGYSAALNRGAEVAAGKIICIMNADIELISDSLSDAYKRLVEDSGVGILAPQITGEDKRLQISWGKKPNIINESIIKLRDYLYKKDLISSFVTRKANKEFYPEWATGAFLLVKRELWDKLGGFDTGFFLYLEDCDFCIRAKEHGYSTLYYPSLKVIHFLGKSKKTNLMQATLESRRSKVYFYQKHNGILQYWLIKIWGQSRKITHSQK